MMNGHKCVLFCISMCLMLVACQDATAPTAPEILETRALQTTPTKPSDDTADSEIVTTPYPSYVLAAIGDSITYGEGSVIHRRGYPGILEAQLRAAGYDVDVYNQGIPGADSGEAADTFEYEVRGANVALIMIGANDIGNPGGCTPPFNCRTLDNIRDMIETSHRLGIVPVLGTVTPTHSGSVLAMLNPEIQALNAGIFGLAAEYQLAVVDTYNAILQNGGDALFADAHHFTDQGYVVIANAWYRVLTESVLYPVPGAANRQ